MLEGRLDELVAEQVVNPHTRELTKRSLKKLVNQLKEEIARFRNACLHGAHRWLDLDRLPGRRRSSRASRHLVP